VRITDDTHVFYPAAGAVHGKRLALYWDVCGVMGRAKHGLQAKTSAGAEHATLGVEAVIEGILVIGYRGVGVHAAW
jgi:hypothetical protein